MCAQPEVAKRIRSHAQLVPSLIVMTSTMSDIVMPVQRDSTALRLQPALKLLSVHSITTAHHTIPIQPLESCSSVQLEHLLHTLDLTRLRIAYHAHQVTTVMLDKISRTAQKDTTVQRELPSRTSTHAQLELMVIQQTSIIKISAADVELEDTVQMLHLLTLMCWIAEPVDTTIEPLLPLTVTFAQLVSTAQAQVQTSIQLHAQQDLTLVRDPSSAQSAQSDITVQTRAHLMSSFRSRSVQRVLTVTSHTRLPSLE